MNNNKSASCVKRGNYKRKNYNGKTYGWLTIINDVDDRISKCGNRIRYVKCICKCGNYHTVCLMSLKRGDTKSCGCFVNRCRTTHNLSRTKFHIAWIALKERCNNKNRPDYHRYGGRGISFCKKWNDFLGFKEDMYKSYLVSIKNNGEKNTTLDRVDNNKDYCKENCRWATLKEQANNRRSNRMMTLNGETMSITLWSEKTGIDRRTISRRIDTLSWSIEKALTTPVS